MSTQPPDEPTRIDPAGPAVARSRTSKLTIALTGAAGFLAGVLLVAALGGTPTTTLTQTQRVTVTTPRDPNATVVTSTRVPPLVGERLDTARDRLDEAKFETEITDGGGLFGPLDDSNWVVTSQDPPAGTQLRQGSTVRITIDRG